MSAVRPETPTNTNESLREYLRLPKREIPKALAIAVGSTMLITNVVLNGVVLADPLKDTYINERTTQETYLSERISSLGSHTTVNCVSLKSLNDNKEQDDRETQARVASVAFFVADQPVLRHVMPIVSLNQLDCDTVETAFKDSQNASYKTSIEGFHAISNIVHEYEHLSRDNANEATTECYATQEMQPLLAKLGYPDDVAEVIGRAHARQDYRLPNYLSPDCHPGGALDLRVSDNFPVPPAVD
ncbi:MAG: hypothetical protein ABIR37_00480 [Candidatus Saccharimonadales bacterium]